MKKVVLEAIDILGVALVSHGHKWTPQERQLYERAIAFLTK